MTPDAGGDVRSPFEELCNLDVMGSNPSVAGLFFSICSIVCPKMVAANYFFSGMPPELLRQPEVIARVDGRPPEHQLRVRVQAIDDLREQRHVAAAAAEERRHRLRVPA